MKKLSPEIKLVLDNIQSSIPKYLTEAVIEKKKVSKEFKEMLEKGVDDLEFSDETRNKWRMILGSGTLDKEIDVENEYISEEIDAFVELEMAKAVIRGELPKSKKRNRYEVLLKRYNKIKNENDKKFSRNN